jgi:hypothetical protein
MMLLVLISTLANLRTKPICCIIAVCVACSSSQCQKHVGQHNAHGMHRAVHDCCTHYYCCATIS